MDTTHAILTIVVLILVIDKLITHHNWMKQQDKMNRALIARTTAEYDHNSKDEIKKMKLENEMAVEAEKILASQDGRGAHYPVT